MREVSIQVLVESHVGALIKCFFDFVNEHEELRALKILTRCAFKKLKKRVCETLFGVNKTPQYLPLFDLENEEEVKTYKEPKQTKQKLGIKKAISKVKENKEIKKKPKERRKQNVFLTQNELLNFAEVDKEIVTKNLLKPPVNVKRSNSMVRKLIRSFTDVMINFIIIETRD